MAAKEGQVPSSPANLRIFMVGKTGAGKSAAGNTILGRDDFKSRLSPESVTKECQIGQVMSGVKTILVTDTPGVCDKDLTEDTLTAAGKSCIYMTAPGPHVFLLVLSVWVRYNREKDDVVQWICNNYGKEALQHAIVLFTHTDVLKGMTLDQYVDGSDDLKKLISDCGGRFHGFNNNDKNRNQVTELLQKIECMVESNRERGREHYTNDVYKRAQKQIEDARIKEKGKVRALKVSTGIGLAATVSGLVMFIVTRHLFLSGMLMGAGTLATLGGFAALLAIKISKNMKPD